ncbi:MAG: SPASM domain-containing protein [Candidatus Aureabacteria bacterium]|nr:SPASM domain-containing protein [Candidatus Auribacterota bacterium]
MNDPSKLFPRQIRIENTNLCNGRCTICPREKLTRPVGTMSFEDFRTIVDQCDPNQLKDLHLQGFGEPLLDKDFVRKIQYARKGLPQTRLFFVTNASLLKGDLAKDILFSGVDKIKISFYGVTPSEYEKIHVPFRYEEIKKNILEFIRLKKSFRRKKPTVSVKYIGPMHSFLRFSLQWLGKAVIEFSHVHNYGKGRSFNLPRQKKKATCPMISRPIMQILWNGDVVPCCYDFNGDFVIGNVFSEGLTRVWEGNKYLLLRRMNSEKKITHLPLCANCDKIK